ncbi:MAG: hypothetical protein MJ223_00030 [Mycoplasmoidaceae bacterium]|nr:hypothetical protein [Mycoplasmoidaceae bacterium]
MNDKSLFYLKEYGPTCQITMSNDIDDTYIGEYSIEVFTKSISNPDLYVITTITINCVDGCSYVDETTGLSYSRTNVNET